MLGPKPPDQLCVPNLHGHFAREHTYDHLMWSYLRLLGQIFMNFPLFHNLLLLFSEFVHSLEMFDCGTFMSFHLINPKLPFA